MNHTFQQATDINYLEAYNAIKDYFELDIVYKRLANRTLEEGSIAQKFLDLRCKAFDHMVIALDFDEIELAKILITQEELTKAKNNFAHKLEIIPCKCIVNIAAEFLDLIIQKKEILKKGCKK